MCIVLGGLGYTFAITQTVNEKDGVNYGYIKNIYKKWSIYFLSVDYIQYYQWYEAALARAEDGVIFGDLSIEYNQNYPKTYYTTTSSGKRIATKAIKNKVTTYLTKIGQKWYDALIKKINNYNDDFLSNPQNYSWNAVDILNKLPEIERIVALTSFDPATWWGGEYKRNTTTKLRTIAFSPSAKINVENKSLTLSELVTWQKNPTQKLVKVFLKKWKIEWFRIIYHP